MTNLQSLPETWKLVRCQDVIDVRDGTHDTPTKVETGIPLITSKNLKPEGIDFSDVTYISEFDHQQVEKRSRVDDGDVLFAMIGTIGNPIVVKKDRPFSIKNVALFKLEPTKVLSTYFRYLLSTQFLKQQIDSATRGGTQKFVSLQVLRNLEIPLPPIAQQKRIAAILDQAEELRSLRRQALKELDAIVQSIFLEMFGDPERNPKGWIKTPFGEICETRLGKMVDQKKQTGQHKRMYLRNANVQWFRFDLNDVFEIDFDAADREKLRLQYGDLLICEGGEPGRAAIWRDEIAECYYQKALHRARPKKELANSEYLAWLLWFLAHRGGLGDHVTAATIAHLTGEKLKVMRIPIPPLSLQQEFARRVEAIEQLKATHRESLAQLDALFASLQHRAFRGEL